MLEVGKTYPFGGILNKEKIVYLTEDGHFWDDKRCSGSDIIANEDGTTIN